MTDTDSLTQIEQLRLHVDNGLSTPCLDSLNDEVIALLTDRDYYKVRAERSEVERDDAIDTLKAWFDVRELAHDAIDETVLDAARGYLRTSRSGGMDQETSDMIEGVICDMARLSIFADIFALAQIDAKSVDISDTDKAVLRHMQNAAEPYPGDSQ